MKHIALHQNAVLVVLVALLHVAAIWAVASNSFPAAQQPQPMEIAVELGTESLSANPAPRPLPTTAIRAEPVAVAKPKQAEPAPTAHATAARPATDTSNAEAATAMPAAKAATADSSPSGASASTANTATAAALVPSPSANVQLPSSDADYLNNPSPAYPGMSRRLGEQGTVIVRALIGADGNAQKAEVQQSSGFERLDRAAVEAALKWRYVPGKRAGVAEAMWFKVPLRFVLE